MSSFSVEAQNNALYFDGVNDYIQTDYAGISGNGARTVEAWIKTDKNSLPANQGGQGQSVIVDWGSLGTGTRFTFNILFNNAIRLEAQGNGISGTIPVNDNLWHHVAVVYDPTATNKVKLYVDGVLDVEGNLTVSVFTGSATDVRIGGRIDSTNYYEGAIDEVRIWNVARTQTEIQANMDAAFCGPQDNLQAYFQFNEGTAGADNTGVTTVYDSTDNEYEGTFNGLALTGTTSNFVAGDTELAMVVIDNTVTLESGVLTATEVSEGVTYQWIDCDNEDTPVEGATTQAFTPTLSGNYAVIITNDGCSVQSDCVEVVCTAPSAIEVTDVTTSTATVSWTENGDATQWEVLYGPAGFDPETEGETVTVEDTTELTLNGLTIETGYDVYVRAVCDVDFTSNWEGPFSFSTTDATTPIALRFDGVNDYVLTDYTSITGTGARTVEAWIKTPYTSTQQIIVEWGGGSGSGSRFTFKTQNGHLRLETGGAGNYIEGSTSVTNNLWHHVAVTYDPEQTQEYKLYIDGELETSGNFPDGGTNTSAASPVQIGARTANIPATVFEGSMDDIRIWDIARTQEEIQAAMNSQLCGAQDNLVAYFKFNEGIASADNTAITTVSDSSGNGYTGTLNSFLLTGTLSNFVEGAAGIVAVELDNSVTLEGSVLTATEVTEGVTYQWIDCNNEDTPVEGATMQSFTPIADGNYAVIITNGGCNVQSDCMEVTAGAEVCATPSAIEISEITASTAMVSWTENGEATQWEVLYGPAGFNIETEGISVTVNDVAELTLDELDANTEYHVYVRAVCGEDFTSEWEGQQAFVTLEEAVCATPSAIEISEITVSTAMVSWTENGEATQWEVLYGPAGFNIETEGTSVAVNDVAEVTLEELDANTEYHVYVRAVCGEDFTSEWEGQQAFVTLEEAVCATPSAIEISEITVSTAMVSWTENGEATQWEVLYGPAGFNIETEGISVTVNDVAELTLDELDANTEYHVYVRAVCGEDFTSEWEGQQAFVTLEEAVCATPSAIEISEITVSTAMVSWTENGEATQWEVLYGPAGFNIETEGTSVAVNDVAEVTLEELDANTEYHVYVRAVCGEDFTSEWEGQQAFVTLEDTMECEDPSSVSVTDITSSTAMVSWTENGTATQWEVLYGEQGFNPETEGMSVTVNDVAEVMLEELTGNTTYDVYVRAVCDEEMTSSWEGPEVFTTQLLGLNDNVIKGFVLYPNPTTGIVRISAQDIIENVVVYNLAGQRLTEVKVNAAASQINLSQLPVGVYVMQVTALGKTGTYKIAIK
ncbi:hypothetical protein Q763_17395 [Flavobacterium beibuense F44-8]|uniref:Fibronectin type-III domain-containing protein n=2 Tax=Flavobacterium beibuense TaxID=657326 RepID=A0A0A2LR26_9FLAO|nr:hypothetical protein Q763_17395 [Flavobacterium beibuense F44-8]